MCMYIHTLYIRKSTSAHPWLISRYKKQYLGIMQYVNVHLFTGLVSSLLVYNEEAIAHPAMQAASYHRPFWMILSR